MDSVTVHTNKKGAMVTHGTLVCMYGSTCSVQRSCKACVNCHQKQRLCSDQAGQNCTHNGDDAREEHARVHSVTLTCKTHRHFLSVCGNSCAVVNALSRHPMAPQPISNQQTKRPSPLTASFTPAMMHASCVLYTVMQMQYDFPPTTSKCNGNHVC